MDSITLTKLVHDRTLDLLRTADGLRQERALRPGSAPALADSSRVGSASSPAARPVARRPSPATAGGCSPAEPAL